MASKAIFNVPIVYHATVVRKRCRNEERVPLRDAMPVEILELSAAEAPVRLRAELRKNADLHERIELRHDGRSYLRPVRISSPSERKPEKLFGREDLENMLGRFSFPPPGRIDRPKSWLTTENATTISIPGEKWERYKDPAQIPSTEDFARDVRDWIHNELADAQRAAVAEADRYVLVENVIHRRTGTPMLAWTRDRYWTPGPGEPYSPDKHPLEAILADRAEFDDHMADGRGSGRWWNWWPISAADAFLKFVPGTPFRLSVDAALPADPGADAVEVGRTIVPRIDHYLADAARHLSDQGLDAYRIWRRKRSEGTAGDLPSLIEAMEAARAMGSDAGFVDPTGATEAHSVEILRGVIARELPHWDALLAGTGLALDRRDEAALADMAAIGTGM